MSSDSAERNAQDRAYVLHSRPFKNTSLILEVFSLKYGRLDLVAKAARRKDSPYQGVLRPFVPLFLVWGGRSEMKTLYKAEAPGNGNELQGEKIYAGFYINELLMYLLHKHESHPELFNSYAHCLEQLAGPHDIECTLRYFELDLLEELGYGASLDTVAHTGESVRPEGLYYYDMEVGVCAVEFEDASLLTIRGSTLLALARRELSNDLQRQQAKHLLRQILEVQLEGRPIKSRELFLKKKLVV